ncbi:hypothetical protein DP44_5531 [Burkholderia pseudomallei]|nr:hypothetical protein DO70_3287 [Burkholderia pseudomallei]KGD43964.1 hypothetical protein DP44_5531 [Burkholderia pseudomallei]
MGPNVKREYAGRYPSAAFQGVNAGGGSGRGPRIAGFKSTSFGGWGMRVRIPSGAPRFVRRQIKEVMMLWEC